MADTRVAEETSKRAGRTYATIGAARGVEPTSPVLVRFSAEVPRAQPRIQASRSLDTSIAFGRVATSGGALGDPRVARP